MIMILRSKYLSAFLTTEHGERWCLSSSVYLGCHGNCSDKQQKTPIIPNCVQFFPREVERDDGEEARPRCQPACGGQTRCRVSVIPLTGSQTLQLRCLLLSKVSFIHARLYPRLSCDVQKSQWSSVGGCSSIIRQRFQVRVKPRLAGRSPWAQPRNHRGVIAQRCGGHVTQTAACDWLPLWGDPVRWLQARRRAAPPLKTVMSKLSDGCHPHSRFSVRLSASNLRLPDVYVKIHPSYLYKSWARGGGRTSLHY